MYDAPPEPDELFALSRERDERLEPLRVGCLVDYLTTDGEFAVVRPAYNMLNAFLLAAGGLPHTAFEIEEHSPAHWTGTHRTLGLVIEVRLKSDFDTFA